MAILYGIVPKAGDGTPRTNPFRMAYIDNADGTRNIVGIAQGVDYGAEPMFLIRAEMTPAERTALVAHADVLVAPTNIDTTIGAALATAQTKLESVSIPAEWLTAGMTWRTMLRYLDQLFVFMQRYFGAYRVKLFEPGVVELDTLYSALPVETQQRLQATAVWFGVAEAAVPAGWTLRQVLRYIFERMPPVKLGDL